MDAELINTLTIGAAFSQSGVLGITLFIFFKNLTAMKKHNEITSTRFDVQSKIEKFTLTLKFADWIKSELSDYLPALNGAIENAFLTKDEIQQHFESVAKNTTALIENNTIYRALLLDEIKKLFVVTNSYSKDELMLAKLRKLLIS